MTSMTATIPAARFIRVSGDTQDEASQAGDCDAVAAREGLAFTLPDFQLHAVSGSKGDKRHLAALEAALEAIRSGEIAAIVVAHSSRLTRLSPDEADLFALQVRLAGGRIYSHDEPHYGSGDLMGKFSALLAHEQNAQYSKDLSGHISRKFRNEIDANGFFRGNPPAGYSVQGPEYRRYLEPDTGQAEVKQTRRGDVVLMRKRVLAADVVKAFEDVVSTGTIALARRLGVSTAALTKMLRSPVYSTGAYRVKRSDGVTVIHRCDPLVSPAVQALAIATLEKRRTGDNVTSRAIKKEDFSGALFCYCGHRTGMHRYSGGGKKRKDGTAAPRVRRYHCNGCGKSVAADQADATVHELMSNRTDWWLTSWLEPGDDHAAELDRVELELRELPGRGLDDEAEDAERARLRGERKRLKGLPSTPARVEHGFKRDAAGAIMTEGQRWLSLDNAGRRDLLTRASLRVFVKVKPGRTGQVEAELVHLDADEAGAA